MAMQLGISLGAKHIGYAVMKDGELMDWGIRTVKGKWNNKKLKRILRFITATIERNCITETAIKIPDVLPVSKGFMQLVGGINVLLEGKNIPARYQNLTDLKLHYCKSAKANKTELLKALMQSFPELGTKYPKWLGDSHSLQVKVFEAVGVAYMLNS